MLKGTIMRLIPPHSSELGWVFFTGLVVALIAIVPVIIG